MFCKECGSELNDKAVVCIKCGCAVNQNNSIPNVNVVNTTTNLDFSGLSPYYQDEFKKIYESNEKYKGKWNWAAFFFEWIWALTKGVWLPLIITIVVSIVLSLTVFGIIFIIVFPFIYGIRGNYMYYNAYVKNKQIPM